MSLYSLRFRRLLSISSSLVNGPKPFSSISSPSPLSSAIIPNPRPDLTEKSHFLNPFQCRSFRSPTILLSPRPSYDRGNDDDKIGPDEILFEGCDYNHWLITMDFPKDPKPTPEEMVETYVQTCAKVVGSVEEAKKRIYACSTTTYQGFNVEVTEEMSEKFRGLPGVVFILPDSYIDPVNKEYGGDKYENGKITPRPPPVQYGRQGGRYADRNRSREPYQQGNSGYEKQGPNRNFPQQNPRPQQNYGPPGANVRRDNIPMGNNYTNAPIGQGSYQHERRDPVPPYQRNYAPQQGGNYGQGAGGGYGQGAGGGYGQMGGAQGQGGVGGYGLGAGAEGGQGAGGIFGQTSGAQGQGVVGYGQGYGQAAGGSFGQTGGAQGQGVGGYGQGVGAGYGQGAGGSFGQTGGAQGQGGVGGYGQGAGAGFGQAGGSYGQGGRGANGQEGYNQGQNDFGQREARESRQGQQRNYAGVGETGVGQGRY